MIHYALRCGAGHAFDGWFRSSADFDAQQSDALMSCPLCGNPHIERALMAPAVARASQGPELADAEAPPTEQHGSASESHETAFAEGSSEARDRQLVASVPADEKLKAAVRALRKAVEDNGVNVGRAFPEEARRIHYGEAEARGIYGEANVSEARELLEEGISVMPIPTLPEDRN